MGDTSPFFTVIIPTLNEAKSLPNLLADLTRQTFNQFSVVVIDGRSRDDTVTLARTFDAQLPLLVFTSTRSHVSFQRNLGSQYANSPWLIFFDADTRISPEFLHQLHRQLLSHPTAAATCFIRPDTSRSFDHLIAKAANCISLLANSFGRPFAFGACIIVKSSVFTKLGGFDDSLNFGEDVEFLRRLTANRHRFRLFPRPRYTYSFRRFRRYGYLNLIKASIKLNLIHELKGFHTPLDTKDYPMPGGNHFEQP